MSTIKRIALASAVSMSLLSSVSFAAVTGEMQGAANAQAQAITKAVNVAKATIQCRQATLRIASAAKAKGGKLRGAELRSAIMQATSVAARKYNIENRCVTPVYVANAASRLTGMYPATGKTLGLAKLGGAGGVAGAAAAAATGGIGGGVYALAGLVGIAAIAAAANNDSDSDSGSNLVTTAVSGGDVQPLATGGNLSGVTQTTNPDTGVITQTGTVTGGSTGSGTTTVTITPSAAGGSTFQVTEVVTDSNGNILFAQTYTRTYGTNADGSTDFTNVVSNTVVSTATPPMSAST